MSQLTKEEMKEIQRLFRPENREEFDLLIKEALIGPTHPIIEKLAWGILSRVRSDKKLLEDLVRQFKEEEN